MICGIRVACTIWECKSQVADYTLCTDVTGANNSHDQSLHMK